MTLPSDLLISTFEMFMDFYSLQTHTPVDPTKTGRLPEIEVHLDSMELAAWRRETKRNNRRVSEAI